MSKSRIEWTDEVWNPVTGCGKVSQGCKHCYAEREWPRLTRLVPAYAGRSFTDVRCHHERLDQPRHWRRPRRVFVNSMSDLFHPDVPDAFIDQVFAVMALCPQHTFQILTKRPERMRDYLSSADIAQRVIHHAFKRDCEAGAWMNADHYIGGYPIMPLQNVWLGVSVEDQATADERIPLLLDTPAAVRWISAEPLLGQIDLSRHLFKCCGNRVQGHPGDGWMTPPDPPECCMDPDCADLHWVVVGGESGPHARPMHPVWVRSLRDQCAAAGVQFLFKQWGEWREPLEGEEFDTTMGRAQRVPAFIVAPGGTVHCFENDRTLNGGRSMLRVGKKKAGRLLDGVLHDGYPDGAA